MAKKFGALARTLVAFLVFGHPAFTIIDQWTPAGFDWAAHDPGPADNWHGLFYNLSDPSVAVSKGVIDLGQIRQVGDGTVALAVPFALGVVWQICNLALTVAGLASTVKGRIQNEGQADNVLFCVTGLLSTVVGIGGSVSAAKALAKSRSRGYIAVAANAWQNSGLEAIDLQVFQKRGIGSLQTTAQKAHNHFVHRALTSLADGEVEFVGYAPDNHRLARRSSSEHPLAPMFRFEHSKYGKMEVTSRDAGENGIYFTISYEGHPTHLASKEKRDEYFQHERLTTGLMEGRFDSEASLADSASISFDAGAAFDQIESTVECITHDWWPERSVMSVQMYDLANAATFGFASVGLFADHSIDSGLQNFGPRGMPLPIPEGC